MFAPRLSALIALAIYTGCPDATADRSLERLQQRAKFAAASDKAEGTKQEVVQNDVDHLRRNVDTLVSDGQAIADQYRAAARDYAAASASNHRASKSFQSAEHAYQVARDQYRLVALIMENAGGSPSIHGLLCSQISNAANSAAQAAADQIPVPEIPSLKLDAPDVQRLAEVGALRDARGLLGEMEQRIGISDLRKLRSLPDAEIDRIFEEGVRSLGCR